MRRIGRGISKTGTFTPYGMLDLLSVFRESINRSRPPSIDLLIGFPVRNAPPVGALSFLSLATFQKLSDSMPH